MLMPHYLLKMRLDSNQITFGFIQEWRIKWQQIKLSLFSVCYSLCVLACVRVCVYIFVFLYVCMYEFICNVMSRLATRIFSGDCYPLIEIIGNIQTECVFFFFFRFQLPLNTRNAKGWIQSTNRISFGKGKACALPKNTDTYQQAKCFGK